MSPDDRSRIAWLLGEIESELHRVAGFDLLEDARAEAYTYAAIFRPWTGCGVEPLDHLTARVEILAERLDRTRHTASDANRTTVMAPRVAQPPASPAIDPTTASVARVYDLALGGKNHFEADRRAGHKIAEVLPEARQLAQDCRGFVRRVVRWLVTDGGIDQIIDIGSGLPAAGNVHEIAHTHRPGTRVVYVDNDPVVLAHARALLARDDSTVAITGDVREPPRIFTHPDTRRLIDLDRPVAVLVSCVLHHLADSDEPAALLDMLKTYLPAGSYLAVANFVAPDGDPRAAAIEQGFLTSGLGSGRFRSPAEHQRYFTGLDLIDPGVVFANEWRPDPSTPTDSPVHRLHLAGLARVPQTGGPIR